MKFYKNLLRLFIALSVVCIAFKVLAHDAWVEPAKGPVFHVFYGHKIPEAYDSVKVTSLKVFNKKKQSIIYSRIKTKDGLDVKVDGSPALFVLEFDNGYWIRVNNESRNLPKSEIPADADPKHVMKYSKTIVSWQPWMSKPQGQRMEFVPVNVTGAPKAGSQMKLQLLLDGKPLSSQMVENNSNEEGPKTDADGYVTVTVLKGINRFATDYDTTQPDSSVKRLSLTSALVFTTE